MKLSGSQRKHLRGLAHSYNPHVQVGKEGLSESVFRALETAIEAHELIKVRIAADRDERKASIPIIEERLSCECVGTIGRMVILFREHPDPEKRTIKVPEARG